LPEKQKLLDEIEELMLRLNEEQENKRKMGDKLSHERHQFQRDKEATQEVSRPNCLSLHSHPFGYSLLLRGGQRCLLFPGCTAFNCH
jgi:hypothetical protein